MKILLSISLGLFVSLISSLVAVKIATSILETSEAHHFYLSVAARGIGSVATSEKTFYHSFPYIMGIFGYASGFISGVCLGQYLSFLFSTKNKGTV